MVEARSTSGGIDCLKFKQTGKTIKPQYALARLEALTKDHDRYICTEVGQHQMWAAQYLGFEDPNRWMTSGGLGTMGWLILARTGAAFLMHSAKGTFAGAFMLGMGGEAIHQYNMTIGIGAWLGTIMLFNVWVLIWPNQKKVLGMVEASADEIAKAKNIAFIASRSNTLMSIPLIMSMVGAGHGSFM